MVDFEWYRSFAAIYKHNSVSEAAKARMMTQPAMSQHLAALEAEAGEPLFARTGRKIVPTERGKMLYSQVAPLVEGLEETAMSFRKAASPLLKTVRIGAAHEFFREAILPRITEFRANTVCSLGTAEHLLELLREDKTDLIVTSKKIPVPGIEYEKLREERFVVIAPNGIEAPDEVGPKGRERWLARQDWLSYGLELPIIRRFWREHFRKRPQIRPIHVIPDLRMLLEAVEAGAGLTLMPTYLLEASPSGKVRAIYEDMSVRNELFFAYQSKNKNMPEIRDAMEIIRERRSEGRD
ncbi:LysR family transcriptional regulator [Cohnella massiliensis]|uniref:LysR family transcriptional regulator n=1 Tax=Cohnella massiliensis TaxID=1816691 RepID=UPI0009BB7120|nr:LysR family transcriptional regulator [Cohnella massiliensis]